MSGMPIDIDENSLKKGMLGLVIALVDIIKDVLEGQALRRMESGRLTEEEMERLGQALMDLDDALESIKREQGLDETVQKVRHELDTLANEVVSVLADPKRWEAEVNKTERTLGENLEAER